MIELTQAQHQALAEMGTSQPIIDPATQEIYFLVPEDDYKRFQSLVEEDAAMPMEPDHFHAVLELCHYE